MQIEALLQVYSFALKINRTVSLCVCFNTFFCVSNVINNMQLTDVLARYSFKGRFLEYRMYYKFANLYSKLSDSTFTRI